MATGFDCNDLDLKNYILSPYLYEIFKAEVFRPTLTLVDQSFSASALAAFRVNNSLLWEHCSGHCGIFSRILDPTF